MKKVLLLIGAIAALSLVSCEKQKTDVPRDRPPVENLNKQSTPQPGSQEWREPDK